MEKKKFTENKATDIKTHDATVSKNYFFHIRLKSVAETLGISLCEINHLAHLSFPNLSHIEQLKAIFPVLMEKADEKLRLKRSQFYLSNPIQKDFLFDLQFSNVDQKNR